MSSPSPASRASMVNSTGRLAGMPLVLSPGPLARTLLASWAGSTLILKGLWVVMMVSRVPGPPWLWQGCPTPPQGGGPHLRGTSWSAYLTATV